MHTKTSHNLGVFDEHVHELTDYDRSFYVLEGPTDNLYEDTIKGLIEIVPLRARENPWEQWICTEGKEPINDDNNFCEDYFASLNN